LGESCITLYQSIPAGGNCAGLDAPRIIEGLSMVDTPGQTDITQWLTAWRQGDVEAREQLFAALYPHLCSMPPASYVGSARIIHSNPARL
jgi:hypothetical protein